MPRRYRASPRFVGTYRWWWRIASAGRNVEAAVGNARLPFLERVDFVGTFRNKQIGPGKKSLTLTLEFRDPSGTLRSEQADAQVQATVDLLADKFGAALRA